MIRRESKRAERALDLVPGHHLRVRQEGLKGRKPDSRIPERISPTGGGDGCGDFCLTGDSGAQRIAERKVLGIELIQTTKLVGLNSSALGTDVTDIKNHLGQQLTLYVEVPLLRVAVLGGIRVVADDAPN